MPIQETYKEQALLRLRELCSHIMPIINKAIEGIDEEDLEYGLRQDVEAPQITEPWRLGVKENNYMEVVFTEIMEHHDGAYFKATFRNSLENCWAERYVSIRSSGKVEVGYALFLELDGLRIRVEERGDGFYSLFIKAK